MKLITIYTDGACSGNPGPGGFGAILMYNEKSKEISGGEPNTTNNRMELMAAIVALNCLKEPCEVNLYTDSAYMCNAFLQGWITRWQANGWLTAKKKPVENQDLWQQLVALTEKHKVRFSKVKGHSDNEYNNRCDELARLAIEQIK
ncbi:MAG: ribonuclease HI [Eubacteriales bacterium]|nr:ribonuclease HI [Eubacteriales bacterium]MCI7570272.1 ribonuclease HI [Clostridiales bacterium]MDD7550190.1 ribonuclease HI [Clostridia bacterium]MDY5754884.1 ribonuclease HI [Eubacteriales bacterium]